MTVYEKSECDPSNFGNSPNSQARVHFYRCLCLDNNKIYPKNSELSKHFPDKTIPILNDDDYCDYDNDEIIIGL